MLIVRSIDILLKKEYTYTYENGNIVRSAECDITVDANEIVTGKTLVNSIAYSYNSEDKLIRKRIISADGNEQTVWYENPEDGSPVVKFSAGGKTITAHSKTDSFGRKVFDELQLGTGFVSRQFHYHAGAVTQEHIDAAKLKSSATTQLVSQIVLSGGRTISYEYDEEERITKVVDSVDGVTEYTYDRCARATADGDKRRRSCQHDGVRQLWEYRLKERQDLHLRQHMEGFAHLLRWSVYHLRRTGQPDKLSRSYPDLGEGQTAQVL